MFDLIKHLVENNIQHTVYDNGNITVHGDLELSFVRDVDELPDNLSVDGSLNLIGTPIKELSGTIKVGGSLYLRNTPIKELPGTVEVKGDVHW